MEEVYKVRNYLNPSEKKLSFTEKIQQSFNFGVKGIPKEHQITDYDRSYGIQKIFDLHAKKDYKPETLFIAQGIFDRYLYMTGVENVPKTEVVSLSVISMLMSAKLEQPISPSFARMINLLTDEEKALTSKAKLIDLESRILIVLGFDFNFPGPIQFLERYLRILDYDQNKTIFDMSFQICKFQLNDSSFLNHHPSKVAASSLILAINIFEWDFEKRGKSTKNFFGNCKRNGALVGMNLDIWNNENVQRLTGYSMEDIKECL